MGDSGVSREAYWSNVGKATGDLLSQTGAKLQSELIDDLTLPERRGKLALTVGGSTAIGFGTTAALAKFPRVGPCVLAGVATFQLGRYAFDALDFLSEAGDANTENIRRAMVDRASTRLAREGALTIESTPGLVLGGSLAAKTVGVPPLYSAIGGTVDRRLLRPTKAAFGNAAEYAADQWAFHRPGSIRLSAADLVTREGHVNVLKIGETIAERDGAWTGVEVARSVDPFKARASAPVKGAADWVDLGAGGVKMKPGRIPGHAHAPDNPIGTRPGLFDLSATPDVGIVHRQGQIAFYVGRAREYNAALSAGNAAEFSPPLQSIVLDPKRETAFLLESTWQPKTQTWGKTSFQPVDYQGARETLSRLDITKPWKQISRIPKSLKGTEAYFEAMNWMKTGTVK